jgi:hypothetical protein
MIKRMFYALAVFGIVTGLVGLGRVAGHALDDVLNRYPGSARIANEEIDLHAMGQAALQGQATYQTPDALEVVRRWYAARLQISPASELNVIGADGCAWLTTSNLTIRILHTVSVLLCPMSGGTRVVVNESLTLER